RNAGAADRLARPVAAQENAECGGRNAECQPRGRVANGLSLQLRIPHSAFRTLMSHTSFKVGRLTCHALEGGSQRLDGGAMFGVVPKPLWQRRIAADERNRILLALRCLLIEHDDGLVLVDTGLGNKEDAKFKDIYGVANEGKGGRTCLEDALAEVGRAPADVRWVINTHLHFDHAGGNTFREVVEDGGGRGGDVGDGGDGGGGGAIRVTFPRATYVVQRGELEFARRSEERRVGKDVRSGGSKKVRKEDGQGSAR